MHTWIIIANIFIHSHFIDDGEHVYELFAVDRGVEHYITYTGKKLPVVDNKPFFAKITVDCSTVVIPVGTRGDLKTAEHCSAIAIEF